MYQPYKGDAVELKWTGGGADAFDTIGMQLDLFYEECFECFMLGEIISESELSPLANAIDPEIFRESFVEIFDAFVAGGTFEAYLTVFAKIFGEDAIVEFTVPAPGKLTIAIEAAGIETSNFISRTIESNSYVFANMLTQADEQILFQSIKGFASQYELEQMLFEMVPAGIYTTISLTLGT
jgi:hypothetical protein